eukprot:365807-Chlamydomonas_euryale.AAC.8
MAGLLRDVDAWGTCWICGPAAAWRCCGWPRPSCSSESAVTVWQATRALFKSARSGQGRVPVRGCISGLSRLETSGEPEVSRRLMGTQNAHAHAGYAWATQSTPHVRQHACMPAACTRLTAPPDSQLCTACRLAASAGVPALSNNCRQCTAAHSACGLSAVTLPHVWRLGVPSAALCIERCGCERLPRALPF